jgi:transposase
MHSITPRPPGSDIQILHVRDEEDAYVVFATSSAPARCPDCEASSASRHGTHRRRLQDLPIQGLPVTLQVSLPRWRCPNPDCARQTFTGRLAETARPFARRTDRVAALVRLIGHAAGGRPSERLLVPLGLPQSDDGLLRSLKLGAATQHGSRPVRVAGIDDWSWRKGMTYGTIVVDLERRQVVDVLADRSAAGTAQWFRQHPETEIVSRDRCGLYARGARDGAPQARQVADRFHLLQNLREVIKRQLGRAPVRSEDTDSSATCRPRLRRQGP